MNWTSLITSIGATLTAGALMFAGPADARADGWTGATDPIPAAYSTTDANGFWI